MGIQQHAYAKRGGDPDRLVPACDDFTYDHERDVYYCPGGTKLATTGTLVNDGTTMHYRALRHECAGCALR